MGRWIPLVRETWGAYQKHNGQWLSAALAYLAAFAVAPLIIVLVEIAGFFLHSHQHVLDVSSVTCGAISARAPTPCARS